MSKTNLFDHPIAIVLLLFVVGLTNIILSVHFISILLAGVVFSAFLRAIEKQHYYSLILIICAFAIIETSQGLKLFNLFLLSLFIYVFILPKVQTLLRSKLFSTMMIVFIFYCGVFFLYMFLEDTTNALVYKLTMNYILDLVIIGIVV